MDWDSLESDWAFQKLWSILAPSNALCLRWRVLIDRIQTNVNLVRRHISLPDAGCPMCMLALESTNHLFSLVISHGGFGRWLQRGLDGSAFFLRLRWITFTSLWVIKHCGLGRVLL